MFLSGVKVGKRKRKAKSTEDSNKKEENKPTSSQNIYTQPKVESTTTTTKTSKNKVIFQRSSVTPRIDEGSIVSNNKALSRDEKQNNDINKSILELKEEEIRNKDRSMDEIYARNIVKKGSRYKDNELDDYDDIDTAKTMKLFSSKSNANALVAKRQSTYLDSLISKY